MSTFLKWFTAIASLMPEILKIVAELEGVATSDMAAAAAAVKTLAARPGPPPLAPQ